MMSFLVFSASLLLAGAFHPSAGAFSIPRADQSINCTLRSASQEGNYRHLIQKIAIRGEDERVLETVKSPTMPLVCKSSDGKNMSNGSINLVEGKRVVTVLHNLVDLSTCAPLNNPTKCSLYDGSFAYGIKWEEEPVELCKQNDGKDMAVEGHLPGKAPDRRGYKVLCKSQLGDEKGLSVTVRGAQAENFSSLNRKKFGKAVAKGEGQIYQVSPYENVVRYDVDTGPGTSGGATTIFRDSAEYLIAVHRGDKSSMSYSVSEAGEDPSMDGLPADEKANFGEGLIFPDSMKICGKK